MRGRARSASLLRNVAGTVAVRGLAELNRAFKRIEGDLPGDLRHALKEAAEPVRQEAQNLARGRISHLGAVSPWGEMRTGVTSRVVYVAPKRRRRGGTPRPQFGTKLLTEAMIPALESRQAVVLHAVENVIDHLADANGF